MALSESLEAQARRETDGVVCAACGKEKKKGFSFCTPCYLSLPVSVRQKLFLLDSEGYAVTYSEAKDFLGINK